MSSSSQNLDQKRDQNMDQNQTMEEQNQDQIQVPHTKPDLNQNHQDQQRQNNQQPKPARTKVQNLNPTPFQNQVQEKPEETESWCSFIYNPRTGAILGRTASSWGRILLFYVLFYGFLSAMFSFTLGVALLTLDPDSPRYTDLLQNPGLVIQPQVSEISFNRSDPPEYNIYVQQLHQLLHKYNDTIQAANDLCLAGEFTDQNHVQDQNRTPKRKVCQFKRSLLRSCSGLTDTSFGFKDGRPCVIIKMNRVVGLRPKGDPYINCTSKSPIKMQYFPPDARLDRMFFPYYGKRTHSEYVQPLVALKLLLSKRDWGVSHLIQCRVEGSDLKNQDQRDRFQGRVFFRVWVTQ